MKNEVYVWDPLVRLFHWSLVLAFFIAYATEDDFLTVHTWAGYTVAGLVLLRLLWGFIGTRHARFRDFVRAPRTVLTYLGDVKAGRAQRYLGHNPLGGAMVIALLVCLTLTAVSGMAIHAAEENAGPMAPLLAGVSEAVAEVLEEVHELFANATLLLVALHILGVLVTGWRYRENLVRAMLTGRKLVEPTEPAVNQPGRPTLSGP